MNAPRNQFSEEDFRNLWNRMKEQGRSTIVSPEPEEGWPMDDSGCEAMCADCRYTPVAEPGDVCMSCKVDYAQMMRGDDY